MKLRKSEVITMGITLFSFAAACYFYPQMPERMASHWNIHGEPDGYLAKFWGLFLMPLVLLGVGLLFLAIPRVDPLKVNIEKFRRYYDGFVILFLIFLLSIYFQANLWNLGIRVSPNGVIPIGLGLLFIYTGVLLKNAKRNWFIGIRTPWTLSSDRVWERTHRIGGKLFKIAGVIALLGVFFQSYLLFFILVPVILSAIYTVVYSYLEYQKEGK